MGKFVGTLALAVVLAVVVAIVARRESQSDQAPVRELALEESRPERRSLARTRTFDAVVGYGKPTGVVSGSIGVATAVPAEGEVFRPGDIVMQVDGAPLVLLAGASPLWRDLERGITGPDVLQLELELDRLGLISESADVDDSFTSATEAAVRDLEEQVGIEDVDGVLTASEILFWPTTLRVTDVRIPLGARLIGSETIFFATQDDLRALATVPPGEAGSVDVGSAVEVRADSFGTATVEVVGKTFEASNATALGERADQQITFELDLDGVRDQVDEGEVIELVIEQDSVEDAWVVPLTALVALAEGGFALERVSGGDTELIPAVPLLFSDGMVAVEASIEDGDRVLVPSR